METLSFRFDRLQATLAEALPGLDISLALAGLCSMLAASLAVTAKRVWSILRLEGVKCIQVSLNYLFYYIIIY